MAMKSTEAIKGILSHLESMGLYDRIIDSFLALIFFFFFRWILVRLFLQFSHDRQKEFHSRKTAGYFSACLLLFILSFVWLRELHSLSTFLGLLTAGLAVALKDPLANVAGWLFLLVRKPFETGDRIQIGSYAGDVIDMDIFQFTLMESGTSGSSKDMRTGRLVRISNATVFEEPLVNFSKGWFEYVLNVVEVRITFESNWKKAKAIMEEIVIAEGKDAGLKAREAMDAAAEKYIVLDDMNLDPKVLTGVGDSGVVLTIIYLCEPRLRRLSTSRVWEQLLERFSAEDDIAFAYPTQRSFSNVAEGKPAAGAGALPAARKKPPAKPPQSPQPPDGTLF